MDSTNPLPLIINPPTPLIINTPQIWYTIIYWEYLLLGGWEGLLLGGGDYEEPCHHSLPTIGVSGLFGCTGSVD